MNKDTAIVPRLLSREQAAAYCGLSVHTFSAWTRAGRIPLPLSGTARWDLRAIDRALDLLSGLSLIAEDSALDDWRTHRARRSERNS